MELYGIRRRGWWASAEELEAGAARSSEEGDKPDSGVRWIRSYVLQEDDGRLGTYCIYEAESPEAIRKHAEAAGFGANEINAVLDTVIVRPDPQPAEAS
jgi:Nickel responsive protein SCO4226-like